MGQKLMDFTKSMDVVDDKTFTLTLNGPYGLVLDSLGKIGSNTPFMMPKRLAETDAFEQVPEVVDRVRQVRRTSGFRFQNHLCQKH